MKQKQKDITLDSSATRAEAISREDFRRGIIKGLLIIHDGGSLINLGWKTSWEGLEECTDRVVDKYMLPRDHRHYDD